MATGISPEAAKESPRRHALHVLIVDDDALLRWAIAQTLAARGHVVSEAANGESAVAAFASCDRIDLVLLDLWLPDSTDLRVLALMRAIQSEVPILVMTAHPTADFADEAAALGASAIEKPFDMVTLAALIERTCAPAATASSTAARA